MDTLKKRLFSLLVRVACIVLTMLSFISPLSTTPVQAAPMLTTLAATEVTSGTIVLNGSISGLSASGWAWVYFQVFNGSWIDIDGSGQWVTTDGNFMYQNVRAFWNYTQPFRAAAQVGPYRNDIYGQELTCTTLPAGNLTVITMYAEPDTLYTNGASLSGSIVDRGDSSTIYGYIQYGTTTAYGNSTPAQLSVLRFAAYVGNLTPATTYHFRAVAIGNTTVYGEDRVFTTPSEPLVKTLGASGILSTAATLHGRFYIDNSYPWSKGCFQYGTDTTYGSFTDNQTYEGPRWLTIVASTLQPGTTYHFRAIFYTPIGTLYGEDKIFATPGGSSPTSTCIDVPLTAGWNLVSLPVCPSDLTITGSLLSAITGNLSSIWYFTGGPSGSWQSYASGAPSNMTNMACCNAYWIYMRTPTTWRVCGYGATGSTYISNCGYPVNGWNMVGFRSPVSMSASNYFAGISYTTIYGFTNGSWQIIQPTDLLIPGHGYWIYVNSTACPLSVSTSAATAVYSTSATINGTLMCMGDDTSATCFLDYGMTTAFGNSTVGMILNAPGPFGSSLIGLSPGTVLYYRARAIGSQSGTTVYGSDMTLTQAGLGGCPTACCHWVLGTAYLNSTALNTGTVIALVNGSQAATTTTNTSGSYNLFVPVTNGATITFIVGGVPAGQTLTGQCFGTSQNFNLYSP